MDKIRTAGGTSVSEVKYQKVTCLECGRSWYEEPSEISDNPDQKQPERVDLEQPESNCCGARVYDLDNTGKTGRCSYCHEGCGVE